MSEITQADRDAAASGYFAWCSGNPVIPERMRAGKADEHSMVKAFARHRKYGYDQGYYDGRKMDGAEERAAIVAWIMDNKDEIIDWFPRDIAGAITDGEHLK